VIIRRFNHDYLNVVIVGGTVEGENVVTPSDRLDWFVSLGGCMIKYP
jgi:hypothetical protein